MPGKRRRRAEVVELHKKLHSEERRRARLERKLRECEEKVRVFDSHLRKQRRMALLLVDLQDYLDDTKAVANAIVEAARSFVDVEAGSLMAVDEQTGRLRILAHVGLKAIDEAITFSRGQGFAGLAWQDGKPVWCGGKADRDSRFLRIDQQQTVFESLAAIPIMVGQRCIGVLNCHNKLDGSELRDEDIEDLKLLSSYVAPVLQIAPLRERERFLALHDGMTELVRRDRFAEVVAQAMETHPGQRIHFFLLDLDDFKEINDRHGHQKGDIAIKAVAAALRGLYGNRDGAYLCHWGGDEFALAVFAHELNVAEEIRTRVREAIRDVVCEELPGVHLSASVGLATTSLVGELPTYDALVAAADRALYEDKGRKRGERRRDFTPEASQSGIREVLALVDGQGSTVDCTEGKEGNHA